MITTILLKDLHRRTRIIILIQKVKSQLSCYVNGINKSSYTNYIVTLVMESSENVHS